MAAPLTFKFMSCIIAMSRRRQRRSKCAQGRNDTSLDYFKLFLIFFFTVVSCGFICPVISSADTIRVAVVQDAANIDISVEGPCKILNQNSGKVLSEEGFLKGKVTAHAQGISLGAKKYKVNRLLIEAIDPQVLILVNGRQFKGKICFIKKKNLRILAVNYVELEDYVKGILYHESSHYWPQDSLKAQAIVCRTYALYQKNNSVSQSFDVSSDIYSQVYGGKTSERLRTNEIVDETKGEVITYQGKIIPAYYHSTCGGHTQDASLLWDIDIAPLKGVSCDFCKDSPRFSWQEKVPLKEIGKLLLKAGYKGCGNIINITPKGQDPSGRKKGVFIETDNRGFQVSVKDFRNIIGPNRIMSARFKVNITAGLAVFEGIGWGHGVGMCQWGAYFMAKQGYDYKQILQYYYPKTEIVPYLIE